MTTISHAQLGWNEAGTPVSDQFDDVYFSNVNGLEETRYVFLTQNHLPQRWQEYDQRRFVVAETGFGTGLNFLALWQWFDEFRQRHPDAPLKELHFVSFEKYPLSKEDLAKAHLAWPELASYAQKLQKHYPIAVPECHRIVLDDGAVTLDLWFGDIKDCLPLVPVPEQGFVDTWFLDGFAPSKNPEMWNQTLFDGMARLAKQGCHCATFTAAGFVRRGLIEAGFAMKKVKGFGTKREMIAGELSERTPYSNLSPLFARPNSADAESIAIVGGGIASATLATALIRRGKRVTLYCQDKTAAMGASGNRQGAVYPLLNGSHSGVSRFFAPAFLFARQFVEQASERFHFDHDWCGVTQLMWDEKSHTKLSKLNQVGFDAQLVTPLDSAQTAQTVGLPLAMPSVHYPLGGWLCPAELSQGLIDDLSAHPLFEVRFEHKVTELKAHSEGTWTVCSQQESRTFDAVVVANGHQFTELTQTSTLPLGRVKGQVSHIPTTERLSSLRNVLCYDGYMTPVNPNTQQHCIGASYDRTSLDTEFDPAAQIDNGEKLKRCLANQDWTQDVDTSDNQSRQGIRCVSRDHLPFIGAVGVQSATVEQYKTLATQQEDEALPVPSYPNLYCMLGLGSRGLSSAPLLAETLASQMCGDPMPLPVDILDACHPSRMWVRKLRKGKPITEL